MKASTLFFWISIFTVLSLTQLSCKDEGTPPTADFSTDKLTATIKDNVHFSDKSTLAETYHWDFGDGEVSAEASPSHKFTAPGNYDVKLTVGNPDGTDDKALMVTITSVVPTASFSVEGDNWAAPASISFLNESVCATSFHWDFGDGETSNLENPDHQYTEAGTYTVLLEASNDYESASTSKEISVSASILPGVSMAGIAVNSSYSTITAELGAPDDAIHVGPFTGGYYIHLVYYFDEGLTFGFINQSPTVYNFDAAIQLFAENPFQGTTEEGIGIGTLRTTIVGHWGQHEDYNDGWYYYETKGISFYYEGSPSRVELISIYEADGFNGDITPDMFLNAFTANQ